MTGKVEDFKPRTCLTCANFVIEDGGRMVEGMPETEFQTFRCAVLGGRVDEFYAVPVPKSEFEKPSKECPFWRERSSVDT